MTTFRAFVSHSFTDPDKQLVQEFVAILTEIETLHRAQFSWDRAIRSEARPLSEKVTSVFEDKNVFIGICSKRERVYPDDPVPKSPFDSLRFVNVSRLAWKTSDWILQEIGFARGRNLKSILLVENDVIPPAGIMGDLQYIRFDRRYPAACVVELMQMISSLSAPGGPTPQNEGPATSLPPSKEDESSTEITWWYPPKVEWTKGNYDMALFESFYNEKAPVDAEQTIFDAYLKTPMAADDVEKDRWAAHRESLRISKGKSASLSTLQAYATKHPYDPKILNYLGQAYHQCDLFSDAVELFERAASSFTDESDRARALSSAAIAQKKAGDAEKAEEILSRLLALKETGTERALLHGLKDFIETTGESAFLIGTLERLVELDPLDSWTRFDLAYQHGKQGNYRLALYHYLHIPVGSRYGGAWNNIGSARDSLRLPSRAVVAYRRSAEARTSLAMSNLAYKYLRSGFVEEAEKLCVEAMTIPNYDKEVVSALGKAREALTEEADKESKLLENASTMSGFLRTFGQATVRECPIARSTVWQGPDCKLNVAITGTTFAATGEYEQPINALALAMIGSPLSTERRGTPYRVEYRGTIRGCAVSATVSRKEVDNSQRGATILARIGEDSSVLMAISADGLSIAVTEKPETETPSHYEIKTLEDA